MGARGEEDAGLDKGDRSRFAPYKRMVGDDGLPEMAKPKVSKGMPTEGIEGERVSAPFHSGDVRAEGRV